MAKEKLARAFVLSPAFVGLTGINTKPNSGNINFSF
jgi:hypothetical protein